MPITVRTHPIPSAPWTKRTTTSPSQTLHSSAPAETQNLTRHMSDSFPSSPPLHLTPSPNGLLDAAIAAWNNHHHLVLRPDDIWIAIISQLGFFIDKHAEELRSFFVEHKGQKQLEVVQDALIDKADYGTFAMQMAAEIGRNVKDPELVPWVIPDFSTTGDADRVAAAVLLMGAMKKYFEYTFCCQHCGIPSVTLLGERADWVELEKRVEKVKNLGGEAVEFGRLLAPIARHMVLSFDEPESVEVREFWRAVASWTPPRYYGSGMKDEAVISGWITTFCFWTGEGERNKFRVPREGRYCIDGVEYGELDEDLKTNGWAGVPVKVIQKENGVVVEERMCRMVAGSVAMRPGKHAEMGVVLDGSEPPPAEHETPAIRPARQPAAGSSQTQEGPNVPSASDDLDAVQPHVGWWVFEQRDEERGWEGLGGEQEWTETGETPHVKSDSVFEVSGPGRRRWRPTS